MPIDHPCDMCGAPAATAVTSRCWMCAACQERGSARATMARMPVLNDPVISTAVAAMADDHPPVFSWLPSPSPRPATIGAATAALEATEEMLREALGELRHAQDSRERAVRRSWRLRGELRDRETDLLYEYTTRLEAERQVDAALRHLDAGDLGAAKRALEGKP